MVFQSMERPPLVTGPDNVVLVSGTRVSLDIVAEAFRDGATPEEIVQQYPSLKLADVYSVVAYILSHALEVAAYLEERGRAQADVRAENERRHSPKGIRARLLARPV